MRVVLWLSLRSRVFGLGGCCFETLRKQCCCFMERKQKWRHLPNEPLLRCPVALLDVHHLWVEGLLLWVLARPRLLVWLFDSGFSKEKWKEPPNTPLVCDPVAQLDECCMYVDGDFAGSKPVLLNSFDWQLAFNISNKREKSYQTHSEQGSLWLSWMTVVFGLSNCWTASCIPLALAFNSGWSKQKWKERPNTNQAWDPVAQLDEYSLWNERFLVQTPTSSMILILMLMFYSRLSKEKWKEWPNTTYTWGPVAQLGECCLCGERLLVQTLSSPTLLLLTF